jgi:nucleotide-binding universal stress UspA family protein
MTCRDLSPALLAPASYRGAISFAPADRRQVTAWVVNGHPTQVLQEAAADANLLVIGSRGHGSFADALLGSVGQYCVHHVHCLVLIMRGEPGRCAA